MDGWTKGPWVPTDAFRRPAPEGPFIGPADQPPVCILTGYYELSAMAPNARLISAAPDLVEALEAVIVAIRADNPADGWLEIIERADDALRKARGES